MIKAILSVLSVFIFLFGNMHLLIGTHFCGGRPVETSVIFANSSMGCEMEEGSSESCEKSLPTKPGLYQKECCQNHYKSLQLEDLFKKRVSFKVSVDYLTEIISLPIELFDSSASKVELYVPDRSPPRVSDNILILFQSFLI